MKCLEKDRTRRYDTANGLAHDVERYLADEPVEACPPSARYRLGKFAQAQDGPGDRGGVRPAPGGGRRGQQRAGGAGHLGGSRGAPPADRRGDGRAGGPGGQIRGRRPARRGPAGRLRDRHGAGPAPWDDNDAERTRELLAELPLEVGGRDLRGFEWHYLSRLCRSRPLTLEGDERFGVYAVTFSPDGRRLATGGHGNAVKLWDAETGRELARLAGRTPVGHADAVGCLAFSPDGRLLASGGWEDKSVKLWDVATGRELASLGVHTDHVLYVAFSPDGRRLASGDNAGDRQVLGCRDRPGAILRHVPDARDPECDVRPRRSKPRRGGPLRDDQGLRRRHRRGAALRRGLPPIVRSRGLQPGPPPAGPGGRGQHPEGLGHRHRPGVALAEGSRRPGLRGGVQPRRPPPGLGEQRRLGAALGRRDRLRAGDVQGPHQDGRPRWRSAPTAGAWPRRAWTGRSGSGTPPRPRMSSPSRLIRAGSGPSPSAPTAASSPRPPGMPTTSSRGITT